jgi:hypothetical protein
MSGLNRGKIDKAQCTLELSLSLIVMVLVLIGVLRIFVWAANTMSQRHNYYVDNFPSIYASDDDLPPAQRANLVPPEVAMP